MDIILPTYRRSAFVILLLGCISCSNNTSVSSDLAEDEEGENIYEMYCITCHGSDGKAGIGNAANLNYSKLNHSEIYSIINSGKNAMPSYSGILSEDDILELTNYVMTLRND